MSKTAILVVNGTSDPPYGTWIEVCLNKIVEYSKAEEYQIFVWNNNIDDTELYDRLHAYRNVTIVQNEQPESLAHFHREPLQLLYESALENGFGEDDYVVTLDNDSFPIRPQWLSFLTSKIDDTTVLAGVWRDELEDGIRPYVHPSGLCVSIKYIQSRNLRFDVSKNDETEPTDTLSHFSEQAEVDGRKIFKLRRSNKRNFHRLLGGIYGDTIYHHGAGSRGLFKLWDERGHRNIKQKRISNMITRDAMTRMLFLHYDQYIEWLRRGTPKKMKFLFHFFKWQMGMNYFINRSIYRSTD